MENNFNRVEKKFCLNSQQFQAIHSAILPYVKPDKFVHSHITSIYLDTDNYDIINRSIEKPKYKEKIRIRMYSDCRDSFNIQESHKTTAGKHVNVTYDLHNQQNPIFIEIKKKFKGIVYKRRVAISAKAAANFLSGGDYLESVNKYPINNEKLDSEAKNLNSQQIAAEIKGFMERHSWPKPAMAITSDRLYYRGSDVIGIASEKVDNSFRITFDKNIKYYDLVKNNNNSWDYVLNDNSKFKTVINSNLHLMEVKFRWGIPVKLTKIFTDNHIYMQSFSKVGNALKQENNFAIV